MNFFTHQDKARGTTRKLVILFACAILALVVITSLLVVALLSFTNGSATSYNLSIDVVHSKIFLQVSIAIIVVVALGAQFRLLQLRGGGKTVAESLGGRLLNVSTRDADERKMLNIVEEMAIATGLPVPQVYLMEDAAINAFAAGYQQKDAVIGVTRGCIQQLTRNELQGVIAHEFSHIFNGDMRLNIRLIGLLHGIMVLGMIGYVVMRGNSVASYSSSPRERKSGGLVLLGLGLVVIGYGGTFFGNMIKAAVSRQREFLADASAVQFTRNPDGISGALKKIGGYKPGSRMTNSNVAEISHMLFGEGVAIRFTGLFATHPPLAQRIKKIEPGWDGEFSKSKRSTENMTSHKKTQLASQTMGINNQPYEVKASSRSVLDSIGDPTPEHLSLALSQLKSFPEGLKAAIHNTFSASVLMYALLIECSVSSVAKRQISALKEVLSVAQFKELLAAKENISTLDRILYLALFDMALPVLKQLSVNQTELFLQHLKQLILIDKEVNLFEWTLYQLLISNLKPLPFYRGRKIDLSRANQECEVLLSVLSAAGHNNDSQALTAFKQAEQVLGLSKPITFNMKHVHNITLLQRSVEKLCCLKPLQKPRLLKAMVKCIDADGAVSPEESELLRAVGNLLDCPIPPVLAGQSFI